METNSFPSDTYYAQDDVSEALRRSKLTGETVDEENPWYDASIHGDFSEDGS